MIGRQQGLTMMVDSYMKAGLKGLMVGDCLFVFVL